VPPAPASSVLTHHARRILRLRDGKLEQDVRVERPALAEAEITLS
jgi:hypothetical protein